MLSAVVERLLKALREARPETVRQFFALACQHMRWELNDLARRLDEQPSDRELRDELVPAPASSDSGISPEARRILDAIDSLSGGRARGVRPDTDSGNHATRGRRDPWRFGHDGEAAVEPRRAAVDGASRRPSPGRLAGRCKRRTQTELEAGNVQTTRGFSNCSTNSSTSPHAGRSLRRRSRIAAGGSRALAADPFRRGGPGRHVSARRGAGRALRRRLRKRRTALPNIPGYEVQASPRPRRHGHCLPRPACAPQSPRRPEDGARRRVRGSARAAAVPARSGGGGGPAEPEHRADPRHRGRRTDGPISRWNSSRGAAWARSWRARPSRPALPPRCWQLWRRRSRRRIRVELCIAI